MTMNDFPNSVSSHPIFFGEIDLAFTVGKAAAHVKHLLFVELRHAVVCAVLWLVAPFGLSIRIVIDHCAKPEMCRVDAGWIVARVTNKHAVWNWPVMHFVTYARGDLIAAISVDHAIAVAKFAALPFPAIIWAALVNLRPKAHLKGLADRVWRAPLMPIDIANGLAFDLFVLRSGFRSYACFLAASAKAVAIGDAVRGIMGLHKNLQFLCQAQDVSSVAGQLSLVCTPVSISHKGVLSNG